MTIFVLCKFGKRKYLNELYHKGHIYMNTITYFQELENDSNAMQSDKNEGITSIMQPDKITLCIDDKNITDDLAGPALIRENKKLNYTHIYSLTGIYDGDYLKEGDIFDKRVNDFGDAFVFIKNVSEFRNRIKSFLMENYKKKVISRIKMDKIKYLDFDSYHGNSDIFTKQDTFDFQKEYRVAVWLNDISKRDEPFSFYIGSIEDIA